jgi:hypothetical protein
MHVVLVFVVIPLVEQPLLLLPSPDELAPCVPLLPVKRKAHSSSGMGMLDSSTEPGSRMHN